MAQAKDLCRLNAAMRFDVILGRKGAAEAVRVQFIAEAEVTEVPEAQPEEAEEEEEEVPEQPEVEQPEAQLEEAEEEEEELPG